MQIPTEPTLTAWLDYIEALSNEATIRLGLERMRIMLERLNIRFDCPVFTVAGTNGKGSTCAMLDSILRSANYHVGMHTSPHLLRFNERALIDGVEVSDDAFVSAFEEIEKRREGLELTYFEYTGLAILKIFSQAKLDAVILEIGLGGRLDAMNTIDTSCGIVCALGIDHAALLGNTREAIAYEKSCIYRAHTPAICTDRACPETLIAHADEINAHLALYGVQFETDVEETTFDFSMNYMGQMVEYKHLPKPALEGANQIQNAAGVLAALVSMNEQLPVTEAAIVEGLKKVRIKARFECIKEKDALGASLTLDVGHNPQAAEALKHNILTQKEEGTQAWAVFGMLKDKDMKRVCEIMRPAIDRWFVSGLPGVRGASSEELKNAMLAAGINEEKITVFSTITEAMQKSFEISTQSGTCPVKIYAFGSFVTVAEVLRALGTKG